MGALKELLLEKQENEKYEIDEILRSGKNLNRFYRLLALNSSVDFYELSQVFYYNQNATIVKTFDDWKSDTSRWIIKGSKGIPVVDSIYPHKKKYYFDISQTYGFKTYKSTDSITDTQLLDAIKSQVVIGHETSGLYADQLKIAVNDFVDYNLLHTFAGTQSDIDLVASGVLSCVVARYNKSNVNTQELFVDLETDNMLAIAKEVNKMSNHLFGQITEHRRQIHEQREQNKQKPKQVTITKDDSTSQQSFFEALDEIRIDGAKTLDGELPQDVFGTVGYPKVVEIPEQEAVGAREVENNDNREFDKSTNQQQLIYGESKIVKTSGDDSRRNGDGRDTDNSGLAQNYKLTDADFANLGGIKSKAKQNVVAIKLIKELQATSSQATIEQQRILARYTGWGGIPQIFDGLNNDWATEYTELKEILTDNEYTQARSSTLNAFYTSKTIIDGVYKALSKMGVNNGKMLEPAMGIGHFVGLKPDTFNGSVHGVELDPITGAIARQLYPQANIQVMGFEETTFADNSFDCVLSNAPFGAYSVHDPKYNKHNLNIHDYFILKSLDKVRVGGVVAIVTTKGTMDKSSDTIRKLFAEKARLIGAIRLPNNAFKDMANTKVTSDILFFQKCDTMTASLQDDDWLTSTENSDGVILNQYFQNHPQMVLGTMRKGKSMYGGDDETYCEPDERELSTALAQAIEFLPSIDYGQMTIDNGQPANNVVVQNTKDTLLQLLNDTKNYCYAISSDNKIYMRIDDEMVEQNIPQSQMAKFVAMLNMRILVRDLLAAQLDNCSDFTLGNKQDSLFMAYNAFTKKYGYLNSKVNKNIFRQDSDYSLLMSLENYDEVTGEATRTDIFNKRTIRKYVRPKHTNTVMEALHICKNETGKVDLKIIEQLTGRPYDNIIAELDGQIYCNPALLNDICTKYDGWETATEYLSGNVRQKLTIAKIIAKEDSSFEKNVIALEQVQPTPLTASDISVRLGVGWIDKEIYKQFIIEKFKLSHWAAYELKLDFNSFTKSWKLKAPSGMKYGFENNNVYGTSRLGGHAIFEYAINLQTPSVYDKIKDADGNEKRVLNKAETIAAREKLRKIQEEFKAWIFYEPNPESNL